MTNYKHSISSIPFTSEETTHLTTEEINQLRQIRADDDLIVNREDVNLFY